MQITLRCRLLEGAEEEGIPNDVVSSHQLLETHYSLRSFVAVSLLLFPSCQRKHANQPPASFSHRLDPASGLVSLQLMLVFSFLYLTAQIFWEKYFQVSFRSEHETLFHLPTNENRRNQPKHTCYYADVFYENYALQQVYCSAYRIEI